MLEITKNSATVGWVKPSRDGGAKIDGYVIEYIEVKPPPEPPAPVEVCALMVFDYSFLTFICFVLQKNKKIHYIDILRKHCHSQINKENQQCISLKPFFFS